MREVMFTFPVTVFAFGKIAIYAWLSSLPD